MVSMLFINHSKNKDFVVYNLKNTYVDLGKHSFKVVLSKKFLDAKFSTLSMIDSDGKAIKHELNYWGRKMNTDFYIDDDVSDGIAAIDLVLRMNEDEVSNTERLFFWIIK
jgi:hypothetical protein